MQTSTRPLVDPAIVAVLCLLVTGCAPTREAYGPADPTSGYSGYSSDPLFDSGIHRVTFDGTDIASRRTAEDFALLRAAEVTLEEGYAFFSVLRLYDETNVETIGGDLSGQSAGSASGNPAIGGAMSSSIIAYPRYTFLIKLHEARPAKDELFVLEAAPVRRRLAQANGLTLTPVALEPALRSGCPPAGAVP
jgi:hypothetical protein